LLFTVRTTHVEHHKGEISFPGGRVDPGDRDTLAAALREASEEVGMRPADARVLGALDDFLSVTRYRVTPHVVFLDDEKYRFRPQPREVAEILLVPLRHLLDPAHREVFAHPASGRSVLCYRWGPHRIWGLTAAILERFLRVSFPGGEVP
jgi:8-oxo-dGTP pyrophosphatase MutT (NUDIX family)